MKKYLGSLFSLIISFISLLISVVAIANVYPRTEFTFDYIGIIIGILSILVTLILGWNIYTVLDIKEEWKEHKIQLDQYKSKVNILEEKIQNDLDKLQINKTEIFASIHNDFADLSIDLFIDKKTQKRMYSTAKHLIQAIVCYQSIGQFNLADDLITVFCKVVVFESLKDKHQHKIKESIKLISHPEKLNRYDELMSVIYGISNK